MAPARGAAAPARTSPSATITVTSRTLGTVSPELFGANLLWPYGGGGAFDRVTSRFYPAFVAAVRRLGLTVIRYPGGTTADSFHWQRAIGSPQHRRPNEPWGVQSRHVPPKGAVLDGPVPSTLGPAEFGELLHQTGALGDVVVNFATGTATEAADFVAYLTAPTSTHPSKSPSDPSYWAALRARQGHPSPFDVPYWEIGNEQEVAAEYGWRSGSVVTVGPHPGRCPHRVVASCLYAFGGITRFARQPVGTYANELPDASRSNGRPHQNLYAYYPPVVPRSETVLVGGRRWREVASLASAGSHAHVFTFSPTTGRIHFGNGAHGAIPPAGEAISISYESGPHEGFVEFEQAMKAMNPSIHVCEAEGDNGALLRLLGRRFPYDCVVLHEYAAPRDVGAPLNRYEAQLLGYPFKEGAHLNRVERAIRRAAGHTVPLALTEYGQAVRPMPTADARFALSLDEAVLVAAQLRQWIDHGVALADKYVLASSPLSPAGEAMLALDRPGRQAAGTGFATGAERRIDTAMIAGNGPRPVTEPTGLVLGLLHHLAGTTRLGLSVHGAPRLRPATTPALLAVATETGGGNVELAVIDASPTRSVPARIVSTGPGLGKGAVASVLDGPKATSYNTTGHREAVRVRNRFVPAAGGAVRFTFPAHSVTLLRFG